MLVLGTQKRFRNCPCPEGAQSGGAGGRRTDKSTSSSHSKDEGCLSQPGKGKSNFRWGVQQILKDEEKLSRGRGKELPSKGTAGTEMRKNTGDVTESLVLLEHHTARKRLRRWDESSPVGWTGKPRNDVRSIRKVQRGKAVQGGEASEEGVAVTQGRDDGSLTLDIGSRDGKLAPQRGRVLRQSRVKPAWTEGDLKQNVHFSQDVDLHI